MRNDSAVGRRAPGAGRRLWDAYALVYDLGVNRLVPYRRMHEDVLRCARAHIRDSARPHGAPAVHLLDLCCGTGTLLREVVRRFPTWRATGIDASASMLARARRKCGRGATVNWHCGDATDVLRTLPDQTFDLVFMCNAFYPQSGKRALVREIRRTLRENGTLILTDPHRGANLFTLLRDHLLSQGPVGIHVLPFLVAAALFSLVVQGNPGRTFWGPRETGELLEQSGLRVERVDQTYGGASYLLVARRTRD